MSWNRIRITPPLNSIGLSLFKKPAEDSSASILTNAHVTVFDNIADGVLILDQDNNVLSCNPSARQIIRALALEPITDRLDKQHVRTVLAMWPTLLPYLNNTTRSLTTVVKSPVRDTSRSFEVTITPITDEENTFAGRVVLIHETTERENAEKALRQRKQQLRDMVERFQSMDRSRARNLDRLDEELRSSLTRIDLYLNNLRNGAEDGFGDAINRIEQEISTLYARYEHAHTKVQHVNRVAQAQPAERQFRNVSVAPSDDLVTADR